MSQNFQYPGIIKQVLYNNKHILTPTLYRGIEVVLTPCCTPSIASIVATCGQGDYNLTVTLNEAINLLGKGQASLYWNFGAPSNVILTTVTWNDSNQMSFEVPSFGAGTYDVTLELFLPTNSAGTAGVTLLSQPFSTVFPGCG